MKVIYFTRLNGLIERFEEGFKREKKEIAARATSYGMDKIEKEVQSRATNDLVFLMSEIVYHVKNSVDLFETLAYVYSDTTNSSGSITRSGSVSISRSTSPSIAGLFPPTPSPTTATTIARQLRLRGAVAEGPGGAAEEMRRAFCVSRGGYEQLARAWEAAGGNGAGMSFEEFFVLERRMMLKALERLLRLLAVPLSKHINEAIEKAFLGDVKYERIERIYKRSLDCFIRADSPQMRFDIAQIVFLTRVVLNKHKECDTPTFQNAVFPLFQAFPPEDTTITTTTTTTTIATVSNNSCTVSVLLLAVLQDLTNERCGEKRLNDFLRTVTRNWDDDNDEEEGNSRIHSKNMRTYVLADLFASYRGVKLTQANTFANTIAPFPILAGSLRAFSDAKNENITLLQETAYAFVSGELAELGTTGKSSATMIDVMYDLVCACLCENPRTDGLFLEGLRDPPRKIECALIATGVTRRDFTVLRILADAKAPISIVNARAGGTIAELRVACAQRPPVFNGGDGGSDLAALANILYFFRQYSAAEIIVGVFAGDKSALEAFLGACAVRLAAVLCQRDVPADAVARCVMDMAALVAKAASPVQRRTFVDSLLCLDDGSPCIAAAIATVADAAASDNKSMNDGEIEDMDVDCSDDSGDDDLCPDKALFWRFVRRNLAAGAGERTDLGEAMAMLSSSSAAAAAAAITSKTEESTYNTLKLISTLLAKKNGAHFVLAERSVLTKMFQSILSQSGVTVKKAHTVFVLIVIIIVFVCV